MSVFWQVLLVAVVSDLATGLGVIPLAFTNRLAPRWEGLASAVAGGMMLSASLFTLADKAIRIGGVWPVAFGLLAGSAFFTLTAWLVARHDWKIQDLTSADSKRAVLILVAMFVHSIPEGVAIGVGFGTGELSFGLLLGLAIGIHNIPEGARCRCRCARKASVSGRARATRFSRACRSRVRPSPRICSSRRSSRCADRPRFRGRRDGVSRRGGVDPREPERCSRYETAWGVMVGLLVMLVITSSLGI